MQDFSEINFKWLGAEEFCPDQHLQNKNYKFYSQCEIDNITYEAGFGAVAKIDSIPHLGVIHYFYEIPNSVPKVKKYIVALELFYKPEEIESSLAKHIDLDNDLEVIKKDKIILIHIPVYAIKSRFTLVYGLQDEDPEELLQEFLETVPDTIYICRFIASFKQGLYYLKGAVYNEEDKNKSNNSIIIIDDESEPSPEKHLTAGNFSVTHVENIASNIKIKLKRDFSPPKNLTIDKLPESPKQKKHVPRILAKKSQQSPSELMKNLCLSPKNRENPAVKQTQTMTENAKRLRNRKAVLKSLELDSDEDVTMKEDSLSPVVILNNIDMNAGSKSVKTNARGSTRRSSRIKTTESETFATPTPTRSSKRQTSKINYSDFYKLNEEVSPPSRKQLFDTPRKNNVRFDETATPRKTTENQKILDTSSKTIDDTPRKAIIKQKTMENTPNRTRKSSVTFDETPRKKTEIEETINSGRKKRGVSSSVEVTPKKQSRIINTPKSGRLNIMTMTPTVEEREEPIIFCNTPMSRARMGLSAYSVPLKVPCRENEYSNIYNFVTGRLCDQSSGCMYISGVPGTGKTMTVCRVMSDLSDQKDDFADFMFLKLNALALTEPRQIYVEIVKKLLNKKLHWEESLKEIEKFFKAKKKKIAHVILVDELDKLCNRKQDVVYNLLDLPFNSVTPLIVITIANTMDLPERILTNKVNSRLGLIRLTFKPYQYKDLVKIVTERLAADTVFKNEALELVARKVAAVSGDARRALAMCSRATEIAEEENKDLVTMDVVDRVITEMSSSSKVQAIQCCSRFEQLVLTAIANEVTRTGNEEVPFLNMFHNLEKLCLLESFKLPSAEVCLKSCHNLGSFRLLITQHGKNDINMTIMLNISTDDVHYALRN